MLKVVYMGTPDFAVPPLKALVAAGYDIPLVITQPDKARDRGKKIQPTPVKEAALEAGLEVYQPERVKNNPELMERLKAIGPDIIIVAAYGRILPVEILELPPLGCINIHGSLLPLYRGAAPIQRSVMAGDRETGVTLMYMGEGMDTGDMIAKKVTAIGRRTTEEMYEILSQQGADLLMEYLPAIAAGQVEAQAQDESAATYASMITKEEGRIDFSKSAVSIDGLVRGMPQKPGAYADYKGVQMKIREAYGMAEGQEGADRDQEAETLGVDGSVIAEGRSLEAAGEAGTILKVGKKAFFVKCGEGILAVTAIQMPGKKTVAVADYLKGNKIEEGTVLS